MRLGDYEVLEEIGRGGMGVVFRGRGPGGEAVAIKVLSRLDHDALERFKREERLLGGFGEADGFVTILAAGQSPQGRYLVMPLVAGGTLRARLRGGRLPIDEVLRIGIQLARALGRAHAAGVVHRDLKPENVLFTRPPGVDGGGVPLVADLGIAKHFRADTPGASRSVELSLSGSVRGTLGYMPPEQINDSKTVGPPADVFALGAMLYECLTGEPAFVGDDVMELVKRVIEGLATPVLARRPETPPWLASVVECALAVDPAQRFADGGALARALEDGVDVPRARKRLVAGAAGVVFAAGFSAAVFAATRSPAAGSRPDGGAADGGAAASSAAPTGTPLHRSPRDRAREAIREIAAGRLGEQHAREVLGAERPADLDGALVADRLWRSLAAPKPPAFEDGLHRIEKLAAWWKDAGKDPLLAPDDTSHAVATYLESADETAAAPHQELHPRIEPDLMLRLVAAARALVRALPVANDELRGTILCVRCRWSEVFPDDVTAEEVAGLDRSRFSPDGRAGLDCLRIDFALLEALRARDADATLVQLVALHRELAREAPLRTFRARLEQLDRLPGHAILAAELASIRAGSERASLLAEARSALARHEEEDRRLQEEDIFRSVTILERRCASYAIARAESDADRIEELGAGILDAMTTFQSKPSAVEVVFAADRELFRGRFAEAARVLAIPITNTHRTLGRNCDADLALMKALVQARLDAPGGRAALADALEALRRDGGLVAPRLRKDAEAALAR